MRIIFNIIKCTVAADIFGCLLNSRILQKVHCIIGYTNLAHVRQLQTISIQLQIFQDYYLLNEKSPEIYSPDFHAFQVNILQW